MRAWLVIFAVVAPGALSAATLTATIKPRTVNLGNSATLTLRCEGGKPPTVDPVHTPRNLALTFVSSTTEAITLNGQRSTATIFTYRVTPKVAGRFAVPEFKARVAGREIKSELLTLTVLGRDGNNRPSGIAQSPPAAILKVTEPVRRVPTRQVYVGEAFPVSMELWAQGLRQMHLPVPQVLNEGIRFTRIRPDYNLTGNRHQGGAVYRVFDFKTGAVVMKSGSMNLAFEVEVIVQDFSRDVFGRADPQPLHLTSLPIPLEVLPLPKTGRPEKFTGAVGNFQINIEAKPTTVKTGEPVELTVHLYGQGSLEAAPVPTPASWDGFKAHQDSSQIEYLDQQRHLSTRKIFKQMVTPLRPEITQVPPLAFSYFNPRLKKYITITTSAIPLNVTGQSLNQTGQGDPPGAEPIDEPESELLKLRTIREHPGDLSPPGPPLLAQAWFLALPGCSLLAFLLAFAIRQREDYLESHEEAARRLEVNRLTKKTLRALRQPETQADAAKFFAGIQLILRAHIGLALRQPAEGITAQTLEAANLNLPEVPRQALNRLLSQDDLTRFANDDGPIDPSAALRDLEQVIRNLP